MFKNHSVNNKSCCVCIFESLLVRMSVWFCYVCVWVCVYVRLCVFACVCVCVVRNVPSNNIKLCDNQTFRCLDNHSVCLRRSNIFILGLYSNWNRRGSPTSFTWWGQTAMNIITSYYINTWGRWTWKRLSYRCHVHLISKVL